MRHEVTGIVLVGIHFFFSTWILGIMQAGYTLRSQGRGSARDNLVVPRSRSQQLSCAKFPADSFMIWNFKTRRDVNCRSGFGLDAMLHGEAVKCKEGPYLALRCYRVRTEQLIYSGDRSWILYSQSSSRPS